MISLRYALHPHLPVRLGFEQLLRLTHPQLARVLESAKRYSITTSRLRVTIYRAALEVVDRGIDGDFAVIGVARGGSAAVLALLLRQHPERTLHLFDRWGDLPDPTPEDGFRAEQYRKDRIPEKLAELVEQPPLEDARKVMHEIVGLPKGQVSYYPGWFDETLSSGGRYPAHPLAFALIHCDYYRSVRSALAFLDRHIAEGGTAIVNDYSWWPGSRQATEEYLAAAERPVRLTMTATRQALLRFG